MGIDPSAQVGADGEWENGESKRRMETPLFPLPRNAEHRKRSLASGVPSIRELRSNQAPVQTVAFEYVGAAAGLLSHHTGVAKLSGP